MTIIFSMCMDICSGVSFEIFLLTQQLYLPGVGCMPGPFASDVLIYVVSLPVSLLPARLVTFIP